MHFNMLSVFDWICFQAAELVLAMRTISPIMKMANSLAHIVQPMQSLILHPIIANVLPVLSVLMVAHLVLSVQLILTPIFGW